MCGSREQRVGVCADLAFCALLDVNVYLSSMNTR